MNQPTPSTMDPMSDSSPSLEASASEQRGNGRETIHRWADMAHQAIDRMEQRLNSVGGEGGSSKVADLASRFSGDGRYREQARRYGEQARRYGEQAQQYGMQARERIRDDPLKSAAIVFATGVLFSRLFMGRKHERVEVVAMPVYLPHYHGGRAHRLMDSSGHAMHRLADSGHAAAGKIAATAMMGAAGAKALASRLWHDSRDAMPSAEEMRERSREYGSMAEQQMQEHPIVGIGLAFGIGALLVGLAMRDRYSTRF